MDKRHFRVVIDSKEHGLYVSSTPSSAAKKAVSKLCASNKSKKVEFYLREITQGSKKKTYGPYLGEMKRLKTPIELKGRVIKYEIKLNLKKNMKGGNEKKISGEEARNLGSSASEVFGLGNSGEEARNLGSSASELPGNFKKMCADTAKDPIYTRQIELAILSLYGDNKKIAYFVEIIKNACNGNSLLALKTKYDKTRSLELKKFTGSPNTHFIISNILDELNNHWNEYVSLFFSYQRDSLEPLMIKVWENVIYQAYLNLKTIYGESFTQTMEEPDTYKFSGLTIPKKIAK
jgi:hypothetical protein